jgi:uncharacterized protein (DUF1330 family)
MAAYMIALTEVTDPAGMDEYRDRVGAVIAQYDGRSLAAAPPALSEGALQPHVAVIIEFPSLERLRAWYDGADYRELKALRHRSARVTDFIVDGLPAQ